MSKKLLNNSIMKHSDVVRCATESLRNELGHFRYTQRQMEEVIRAYINALISALGTGRPVRVNAFGVLQAEARPARKKRTAKYRYIRKCPFYMKVKVRLTPPGLIKLQSSVRLFNHFIDGRLSRKGLME